MLAHRKTLSKRNWRSTLEKDTFKAAGLQFLPDLQAKIPPGFSPQHFLALNAGLLEILFNTSRLRWFQFLGMMRYVSGFIGSILDCFAIFLQC